MKKMIFFILFISFCLCSCGSKESQTNPGFPGLSWEMDMKEALNALHLDRSDISYVVLGPTSSLFVMEDYELFGAKTKRIDFHFIDYAACQEYHPAEEKETEGQELFDIKHFEVNDQILDLTDGCVLAEIIVYYPDHTNMAQVLEQMKKVYGDTVSDILLYEHPMDFSFPREYKDSEQIKIWAAADPVGSFIPAEESQAYLEKWKRFLPQLNTEKWADWDIFWDTFLKNARMQTVLWMNEKDQKRLQFRGSNAGIYRTLHAQISGQE